MIESPHPNFLPEGEGARVVSSAPGKLVLLGEYAVLEGAPALVMAVDRRARVRLTNHSGPGYMIDAPNLGIRGACCRLEDDLVQWPGAALADAEKLQLVGAIIASAAREAALPPFRAELDTDAFFTEPGGSKLGLGSSAALTVALAGALRAVLGEPAPEAGQLIAAHREMQNGRGSGVDIAASLHGGVIAYRVAGGRPEIVPAELPAGVEIACVWSGRSASTGAFLSRIEAWRERAPTEYSAMMARLASRASAGVAAAQNDDAAAFLETAQAYAQALAELGRVSGVDIMTPEHVKIAQAAVDCGAVYKTCGAGGGDIGIAFATDPDRLAHLRRQLGEAGFRTLDLARDARGLRVE